MDKRIRLPNAVAAIYRAVAELKKEFPCRNFTPDGHLVGHLGEVIAAKEFGLTLLRDAHPVHDAKDAEGRCVQIKLTAGNRVSLYEDCDRLLVMRIVCPEWAELIYYDEGKPACEKAGRTQKNGQRTISLSTLRGLAAART